MDSSARARADEVCTGANFIAATPQGRLYATDGMGKAIVALEPDPEDGELRLINKQSCAEIHDFPCHIDFTKDGRWALTAAYMDGTVAVWPIDPATGELGACTDTKKQCLRDPNPSLADRQEQKEQELQVDPVINVMGSTAGAGSGEFHTYRGYRTKEMARLADFEKEAKIEAEQKKWEASRAEAEAEAEAKHAKGASKRNKKKEKRKAAVEAEREKRAAKRVAGGGAAEGSGVW